MQSERPRRSRDWRAVAAAVFLSAQVVMVLAARGHDYRYFCWAPHDEQAEYRIAVHIDGVELAPDAILARYRLPVVGVDPRALRHVLGVIERTERRLDRPGVAVVVRYRINGSEPREWRLDS